jgi:AcrR family transcriptional regulator
MTTEPVSPPASRRRRLEPDERRAQILACARKMFRERPYDAVSTSELAQRAGVTRGLVNHYFGTKRELYLEVVRDLIVIPEFAVAELAHGTLERRAAASLDRYLEMIDRNRNMWLAAVGTGGYGRDPDVERILWEADEIAADRMIEMLGLTAVQPRQEELRAMIRAFSGMAKAATREWLTRRTLTREQTHHLLTTMLIALVRDAYGGPVPD